MRMFSFVFLLNLVTAPVLAAELRWHEDYMAAYQEAATNEKLLLVSFYKENQRYVPQPEVVKSLQSFVLLNVPTTATVEVGGEDKLLQSFGGFRALKNGPGLAIVNLKYKSKKYRYIVETLDLKHASDSATRVVQFLEAPARELGPKILTDEFGLDWHLDYSEAYAKAKQEKKLLLVAFDSDRERFSPDLETADKLRELVSARLRVADSNKLLSHVALRHFHRAAGIGVIDLKHEGKDYGRVVQVLTSEYLTMKGTRAMVALANGETKLPELQWLTDYHQARAAASQQEKMLLIAVDSKDKVYSPKPKSVPVLHGYVLLRQKTETEYKYEGKLRRLLQFRDFAPMRGKAGLVIYDFEHKDKPYYQQVVGVMPYRYLGPKPGNRVFDQQQREYEFLILEPNTLTRRTLAWAIRVSKGYGESQRLRSADGQPNEHLMQGALRNSKLQCAYGCGHFAGGLSGAEIASPGPGEDIVDGALNMVRIWRGSPPHYGVMVRYHRRFGYDMAASRRNHWYGTGRF